MRLLVVPAFVLSCAVIAYPVHAQPVTLSGLAYIDYEFVFESNDGNGDNGFGYRRIYLTADYRVSELWDGRLRLEMRDDHTSSDGMPVPFVKDFWVRRRNAFGGGHEIAVGVAPTPVLTVSEAFWGFRSLEKTILDRQGVAPTRDLGLLLRGRITKDERIRYGLMFANNSGVSAETDLGKRVYAQLEAYPDEHITFTLGGDYAAATDNVGEAVTANSFLGYSTGRSHLGVEAYLRSEDNGGEDFRDRGLALFARSKIDERLELVARFDMAVRDLGVGDGTTNQFFLVGVAISPDPNVHIIPNVQVDKVEGVDVATILARITLHVDIN